MRFLALIPLLASFAPGAVVITANSPKYNWQVLAGSVRPINVGITGGTGNLVNWTVASTTGGGSATLSASTNALPLVSVTIGSTAGTCSITGVLGTYAVTSTVTVTVQAQSVDDASKTATFLFNVCSTPIVMAIAPFYRTLYANQKALLQAYVVGASNQDVAWSITSSPGGGNGALDDTTNHDAVFHASVAGRYTLQALSSADGATIATATMYVTGNAQPYLVTPNGTEPVDCSVDPSLTGVTYTVGSGKTYATIGAAPLNTMVSGSTVVVYNTDLTGLSPTVYNEYIQLGVSHTGSATQPLRVVGCPDSLGNLPVLDANNASAASWVCTNACAGFGVVSIWPGNSFGLYAAGNNQANYIIFEGFDVRNAQPSSTFIPPAGAGTVNTSGTAVTWASGFTFSLGQFGGWSSGDSILINSVNYLIASVTDSTHLTIQSTAGTQTGVPYQPAWVTGASCMNLRGGYFLVILGNELENCSNGTFADSNTNNNGWKGNVFWTAWEGNNIHGNGNTHGGFSQHQLYVQGWGQLIQFNQIHDPYSGMGGAMLKTRGLGDIIRYNNISTSALGGDRTIDMIDVQDATFYSTFEGYLDGLVPNGRAPAATGTDLVVDGSNNLKVTSASHSFTSADGTCIGISAGAGFTPGDYRVNSFSAGAAILASSPAATGTTGGTWAIGVQGFQCQGDTMGPNVLAAWQEAWHYHFVYANVTSQLSSSTAYHIHYGYDHDAGLSMRLGTLYFYNNSMYQALKGNYTVIDDAGAGGTNYNTFEPQHVSMWNNIGWVPFTCTPGFSANNGCLWVAHLATIVGNYATNLWGTTALQYTTPINGGSVGNQMGVGWSSQVTAFAYPLAVPIDAHSTGISAGNFLNASSAPFDTSSFLPINPQAGTALTGIMAKMPVRFMYRADLGYAVPRNTPVTASNGGTIGALDGSAAAAGAGVSTSAGSLSGGIIR